MSKQDNPDPGTDEPIRETFEEFEVGETRVAMIADPENGHAWIQSDLVVEVDR